jgi:hypothetical protein
VKRFLAFVLVAVVFGAGGYAIRPYLPGRHAKPVTLHGYVFSPAHIIQLPSVTDCDTSRVGRGNRPGPAIYAPDGTLLAATKIADGPLSVGTGSGGAECALPWRSENVRSEPTYKLTYGSQSQAVNLADVGTSVNFSY